MLRNNSGKDCPFQDTITKIQKIIQPLGIHIEEHWTIPSEKGPYSVRITIPGLHIGTNGKGLTRSAALASALGEFMERLQNEMLFRPTHVVNIPPVRTIFPDAVTLTKNDFTSEECDFIINFWKDITNEKDVETDNIWNQILAWEPEFDKKEVLCVPFYNPQTQKSLRIPYIFKSSTGSNGMSAGNTPAEAIVQGISEICERATYSAALLQIQKPVQLTDEQIKILSPQVWEQMKFLIDQNPCSIRILRFPESIIPTFCCIIEKEKKYAIAIGSHPLCAIAMSRAFTESLQGRNLDQLANRYNDRPYEDSRDNRLSLFAVGIGQHPDSFFKCDLEENIHWISENTECSSNQELLKKILNKFSDLNLQVLLRNVDFLGFPAFHILIQGLSPMFHLDSITRLQWYSAGMAYRTLLASSQNEMQIRFLLEYSEYLLKKVDAHRTLGAICPALGTSFPDYPQDLYLFVVLGYYYLNDIEHSKTVLRQMYDSVQGNDDSSPSYFHEFSDFIFNKSQSQRDWKEFFESRFLAYFNKMNASSGQIVDSIQLKLRENVSINSPSQTASAFDL